MKVFVGWPYEAGWIEENAIPLIETYGVEVLSGKELQGQILTDGVKGKIAEAEGAVFFTTRRERNPNGTWKTSDWVVDEIKHANSLGMDRIYEVREEDVDYPNKIHQDRQYTVFKPGQELKCLVELGKTIARWKRLSVKLQLLPEEFIRVVRRRIVQTSYSCSYAVRQRGRIVHQKDRAEIVQEGQGVFVYANDLPAVLLAQADAFLEVTVDIGDQWYSAGIPLTALEVSLEKL